MSGRPELSLVLPVFDEEPNVGPLLDGALEQLGRMVRDFEIIVVDDGSRDRSAEIVRARQRSEPRLRLLRHPANVGYGAALRSGLRAARGELVFFTDADRQFHLRELEGLLELADTYDIVAGYRAPRRDPRSRRAIAAVWGALVRSLFGLRVRDIDCAFKLFHASVLEAIPIASIGAFVNTEILVRAQRAGFSIHQIPVTHRRRRAGRAKGARPRVILRAIVELGLLFHELRRPVHTLEAAPTPRRLPVAEPDSE